jgi:hypothetical protein
MRNTFCLFVILVFAVPAAAQKPTETSTVIPEEITKPLDVKQILLETAQGRRDPFVSLPMIIERKDSAIVPLAAVFRSDFELEGKDSLGIWESLKGRIRVMSLTCIAGIGTRSAFMTLMQAASSSKDVNCRGEALKGLASAYYVNGFVKSNVPDKELIHLFLSNVDDTAIVSHLQSTIGAIAREGMIAWTGRDLGEPQGMTTLVHLGSSGKTVLPPELREQWWGANSTKVSWDPGTARFRMP